MIKLLWNIKTNEQLTYVELSENLNLKSVKTAKGIESLPQTLIFLALYLCNLIFQTMYSARSDNLSLKYQRCTSSDCEDIGNRKLEFVTLNSFPLLWLPTCSKGAGIGISNLPRLSQS